VKYFAYGSNLDQVQMAQRCPGARLIGPAQLANHRMCFPRRSPVRGCAVASLEPHKGGVVWGVVYELEDDDLKRLDAREGYDPVNPSAINRYCRVDVIVHRADGEKVEAVAYVAVPEENPGRPSSNYLKHIVEGAVAHSFPDDYIESLRAVVVVEDGGETIAVDESEGSEPEAEPTRDDDEEA
jgi:cation transport regulator ChaC